MRFIKSRWTVIFRGTDGVALTEQGKTLFDYVTDLQRREQDVLNEVTGRSAIANGIIRIGAFSSVMRSVIMPALIPLINSEHQLKAEFFSRELRELPPLLLSGEVDFIVVDEILQDSQIASIALGEETLVHIRNPKQLNKLDTPCFLDHDASDMTTYSFFEAQGQTDFEFDRCFYDDVYGLIDGVKMGFGEAIVSKHMVKESESIQIVPHERTVKSDVVLAYIENRYLSSLQKEVIDQLRRAVPSFL